MKDNIVIYSGLYGDNTQDQVLDFIDIEPLESRSKTFNWEIQEHLHTELAQLFIIEQGQGKLFSERNETHLVGPCAIFIPTNTLHGFSFEENISGEVITFNESLLERIFRQNQKILLELNQLNYLNFDSKSQTFEQIITLKKLITNELNNENKEKRQFVDSLFHLLFLALYRQILIGKNSVSNVDNRTLKYFQQFQKQIKQGFSETKTISQYAKEIGITTMHLNRVCKSIVKKSPIQIIQERQIKEAKKYLLNTSYTIAEISYFLNFNDPAYFTRLFKKHVGVSPSDFRKI